MVKGVNSKLQTPNFKLQKGRKRQAASCFLEFEVWSLKFGVECSGDPGVML
jgi:hypothetical protein